MPGKHHKYASSAKQQRFMGACSHGSSTRMKCPPQSVARELAHKPPGGYRKKQR